MGSAIQVSAIQVSATSGSPRWGIAASICRRHHVWMFSRWRSQPHTNTNSRSTAPPDASAVSGADAPWRAAVRATRIGTMPMMAMAGGQALRYTSRIPATSGGMRLHVSPPELALAGPATTLTVAPATAPSALGGKGAPRVAPRARVGGPRTDAPRGPRARAERRRPHARGRDRDGVERRTRRDTGEEGHDAHAEHRHYRDREVPKLHRAR